MNILPSTGIEKEMVSDQEILSMAPSDHSWEVSGRHFRLTQVTFQDCTDAANELVHEREWLLHPNEVLRLKGNLFCLENLETNAGMLLIQPGPLPHARPETSECDVSVRKGRDRVYLEASEIPGGAKWVRLDWCGGEIERTRVLHRWQQACRPEHVNHTTPHFLSNTWGDRSRDSRMQEAFILKEIDCAAEIGVEVVQLDDGWQKGITSNSALADQGGVWEGFWNQDPCFWEVHPHRFPRGLKPLTSRAAERGVALGLWFAPDSWNDFANWELDAERILSLHQAYGISHFKLDGIKAHSVVAFDRLRAFVDRILTGSGGEIVFDLDVTAETRPGYWGLPAAGVLFVENRYTDWGSYWPHQTLRSLWKLAKWVDPRRLRMEFLNVERNQDRYDGDILAPAHYGADTLFATVMAANPLGWFEISGLSASQKFKVSTVVSCWKEHRSSFFNGVIFPVGPCPDGFNISGFISLGEAGGFCLLFRGAGPEDSAGFPLPFQVEGTVEGLTLNGTGTVTLCGKQLNVTGMKGYEHVLVHFED